MSAATIEHAYQYAFASQLNQQGGVSQVRLATSGGADRAPYFFQARLVAGRRGPFSHSARDAEAHPRRA
jgi:hypothetical protein